MIYLKEGNIPLNLAYDDSISQEANSTYQLSFKFPLSDEKWTSLKKEVFLIADDLHGEQEFFIGEITKENGFVQVYAKQVATLLNYYSIGTLSVDRVEGQVVMSDLAGSIKRPCPFTFFSDILDRHTFNQSNVSVIEALSKDDHSIIGQWGGDLVRDKYQVKLLKNGGSESEALFMYKKNLSTYKEKDSVEKLRTRIHFTKTIKETSGASEQVISVTVDSPLINKYSQIYESNVEVTDQDVKDLATLKEYAKNYYSTTLCDVAENSIELSVKDQDADVKMFDVVSVFHERFGIDLRLKISKYAYSPMSKRLKSVGFGQVSRSLGSTIAGMVSGSVDKATNRLSANFEAKLQKEIDNTNKHIDAEFDKRVEAINDDIEQAKASAEVYADGIKQEIAGEMTKSNQQYQLDKQAQDKQIADVLSKASASVNLATEAKTIGNQAKLDAAGALSQANQAKIDAITEANRLVELSKTTLASQIKSVDVKVDDVANQITAKVSQTDFDKLKGTVTGQQTTIDQTAAKIALKADKTATDNLSQQISQTQADLSVANDKIKALVTKTDFNGLTGRMTTAETQLVTQAGEISKRLTRTEINSLVDSKGYQTASQVQQMVTRSADTLTQTISQVESRIPNEFSGNMLADSGRGWNNQHMQSFILADNIYKGSTYTVTVRWWRSDNSTLNMGLRANETDSWQWINLAYNPKIDAWTFTFVSQKYIASGSVIYFFTVENNGIGSASWATLVKGPVPLSSWQASKADLTTVTAFNEVKETVRSHTQTIAEQGISISQVLQTSQGLVNRVADLTAGGNLVYDPTNYSKYREREANSNLVLTGTSAFKLLRITQSGLTSGSWKGFQMPLHSQKFVAGEKLSYRVNLWVDVLPDAKVGFEIKNGGTVLASFAIMLTKTGSNQIFTGTFTVNTTSLVTDDYGLHVWLEKNGTVAFGQLSIVRGDTPPQSFVDSTSAMQLATETQVALLKDSWSFKTLNSAGDILSQANLSSSQFLLDAAKIRLKGKTLADEIQAIDGKFGTLFVADGTFGKLNANIIGAQAITGGQIKFDQAFFDKLMANEAYLKQLFAKNAFITQVQSVTMSAEKIIGGTLSSINGATKFDLQTGWINMDQQSIGIRNQFTGRPLQYLVYGSGTINGVEGSYTALLSNRNGLVKMDSTSVGIQFWNARSGTNVQTAVNLYGKRIDFTQSGQEGLGSIGFNTDSKTIDGINDIYIKGRSLAAILNNIFDNFRNLDHDGQYQRGYYSIW